MTKLFKIYYEKTKSDDLGGILGGMSFLRNKQIVDDAMLEIWTECLDKILKHQNLRNYNNLTILQAFLGVGEFLKEYFGVVDLELVIEFLEKNIYLARQRKRVDPVLWQNWLKCVDAVLAVKDSRDYFYLLPKK